MLLGWPFLEDVSYKQGIAFFDKHTPLNLVRLHSLPGHWVVADDVRQSRRTKVLLAGLLLGAMFPRVLLHGFQPVSPPSELVVHLLIEFTRLLANF